MASKALRKPVQIPALCDIEQRSFPIAISDITPAGCLCEADADWDEDFDFLHLKIAELVEINGKVLWHDGHRAEISFFGQIHPVVVDRWIQS
jgi:hypothetical protein